MAENAYKEAGVDIEAGNALVEAIKPSIKKTMRPGVMGGIGGFGACFDLKATEKFNDPILVSATDGVGTKLKIAIEIDIHNTVGIDLVAMCVNDLIVQGAEPLFFLDYFASGKLDVSTAQKVIEGIAEGCQQAGCALVGGETAEMPSMYEDKHYDLAGFVVGAVERSEMVTGEDIKAGDTIIALPSSGLHSNGFSLARKIAEQAGGYTIKPPFESTCSTLGEALLAPTIIYVKPVLQALATSKVKGLANITGGGIYENIPRSLPKGLGIKIDASKWTLPPVLAWLKNTGSLSDKDFATTFNAGIGMVLFCAPEDSTQIIEALASCDQKAQEIGKVTENNTIEIENTETAWQI